MKTRLTLLSAALLLALCAGAAAPDLRWSVDTSKAAPADWQLYQGETMPLAPAFTAYGLNVSLSGATASFLWQTNGMGTSWWSKAASIVTGSPDRVSAVWHPTNDCGASAYAYFIRVALPSSTLYRASGTIKMLHSPGFAPATLPPPSVWPDLAASLAPLVAPLLSINLSSASNYTDSATNRLAAAITNEATARSSADVHLQQQITLLSECGSITGQVGSASLSDSALRLASADSNWWVSVEAGTATLWRISRDYGWMLSIPTPAIVTSITNLPQPSLWLTYPFSPDNYSYSAYGYTLDIIKIGDTHTFSLYDGNGDYYETSGICVDGSETDGIALSNITIYSTHELPNATLTYLRDGPATNAAGTYVTAADLASALASFVPASATNALAIASNAWQLAGTAYDASTNASAQIVLATNAVMRALISTNAWLEANSASNTVSVYVISTNGTNVVTVGGVTGIDPAATNLLWIALNSGLSSKAPRAWGGLAPDGTANPDPEFQTWLNAPATVFASGYTWTTYGLYAAIVSTGMVAQATGSNGMWRISVDSTNYLGVVQGGSIIVGARANSLSVYEGGTTNGWAQLTYDYDGGNFPTLYFTPSLAADFTQVVSALWTDNLDGSATVVAPATSSRGFWRAMTSSSYSYALESTMPFRPLGGVIGATNAPPVRYDSTVEISAGGHTYRIPAQLAD